MSLHISHGFPSTFPRPPTPLCNSTKRTHIHCSSSSSPIPARDRVIDFGKHRGTMLGALPSRYLKWVSNNLRAREMEHWAKLADEVLQDPVYKDRIEWEFAESVLTGDGRGAEGSSAVDALVEFSERFGWDNEDKIGWSRIDFAQLGTSKGGRIPRKGVGRGEGGESRRKKKVEEVGGGRRERIERRRSKGGMKLGNLDEKRRVEDDAQEEEEEIVRRTSNPFPGRQALLKKVFDDRSV